MSGVAGVGRTRRRRSGGPVAARASGPARAGCSRRRAPRRPTSASCVVSRGRSASWPASVPRCSSAGLPVWSAVRSSRAVALTALRRAEDPVARRAREAAAAELPHLVLLLASALRGGAPPGVALGVACAALPGPAADRLDGVRARLALGLDPVEVWDVLADDPVLAPLARTFARAARSGSRVADAVDRLSADLALQRAQPARGPGPLGRRTCRPAPGPVPAPGLPPDRDRAAGGGPVHRPDAMSPTRRARRAAGPRSVHSEAARGGVHTPAPRARRQQCPGARQSWEGGRTSRRTRSHHDHRPLRDTRPDRARRGATSVASPRRSTPSAPPRAPGSPGCSTRCSPAGSATLC